MRKNRQKKHKNSEYGESWGIAMTRLVSALLFSWTVFFCLYWVGMKYILPRLPTLALWDSLDRLVLSLSGLELSLFRLIHLGAGFLLATQGAVLHHLIRRQDRARRRTGKPVTTGFFARARMPLYGSMLVGNLGLYLAFCSGWGIIAFGFTGFFTVISTLIDEKRRVQPYFGNEYTEYRSRVRSLMLTPSVKASIVAALLVAAAGLFF